MAVTNTNALDVRTNGGLARVNGRPGNARSVRHRLRRSLGSLVSSAMTPTDSSRQRALASAVRRTALAACEQRVTAGVVVFADIREEQMQLEHLATLIECGEVVSPAVLGLIERIVDQRDTPAHTATELVAILEAVEHYAGQGDPQEGTHE